MADRPSPGAGILAALRRLGAALSAGPRKPSGQARFSGDPVRGPARLWRSLSFGSAARAEIWQLVADVVEAGVSLDAAVGALVELHDRFGKRGRASVLAEMSVGLRDANPGERLAPYVSASERILLEGLGHQKAAAIFGGAARLLRNRTALRKAVLQAVAMPSLLFVFLVAMVVFFGRELLPAFAQIVDFDDLPLMQDVTVRVTLALARDPQMLALGIVGIIAAFVALMRFWTGPGRAFADRFPPFSLMRLQAGTGFLFAVIEYGRNGTAITPGLLERMAQATGRYEASRIRALVLHLERTGNLGTAALQAGQGFPDPELAVVLQLLWNEKGGIKRAGRFLERRLERIESGVKARMAVLNAVLLTLVTGVLLLMMSIMLPVFEQLNQAQRAAGA